MILRRWLEVRKSVCTPCINFFGEVCTYLRGNPALPTCGQQLMSSAELFTSSIIRLQAGALCRAKTERKKKKFRSVLMYAYKRYSWMQNTAWPVEWAFKRCKKYLGHKCKDKRRPVDAGREESIGWSTTSLPALCVPGPHCVDTVWSPAICSA